MSQEHRPAGTPLPLDIVAEATRRILDHFSMECGPERSWVTSDHNTVRPVDSAKLILKGASARLEAISRAHCFLAHERNGLLVNIDVYLGTIAERITSRLPASGNIQLSCSLHSECLVPSEKAILLGLLVDELIANSLKYAHPHGGAGELSVESSFCDGRILKVAVRDDGVGLPAGVDPYGSNGSGFHMTTAIASQIGGTIGFVNHSLGLKCIFRMPLSREEVALKVKS